MSFIVKLIIYWTVNNEMDALQNEAFCEVINDFVSWIKSLQSCLSLFDDDAFHFGSRLNFKDFLKFCLLCDIITRQLFLTFIF